MLFFFFFNAARSYVRERASERVGDVLGKKVPW